MQIAIFVQLIKRHYFVVVCSSKMIKRQNFVIKIFETSRYAKKGNNRSFTKEHRLLPFLILFLSVDRSLHQMSDQLLAVAFEHVDNRNLDHGVAAGLLVH